MPPSQLSTQLDQTNASIILALSKMGIYMERDRKNLDKLSPSEQNIRLQKAFDRTVENCCILPLLFGKHELGKGKLVLLGKPQWTGWRDSKMTEMRRKQTTCSPMQALVDVLGESCTLCPTIRTRLNILILSNCQASTPFGVPCEWVATPLPSVSLSNCRTAKAISHRFHFDFRRARGYKALLSASYLTSLRWRRCRCVG